MDNPRISIIVPVYKAENFIEKCVESILNQTMSDLELILVDDGSPDKSGAICDGYARKDNRVRVLHQKNSGVSAARSNGIGIARGEYIGFVDSDDWIAENMYEKMLFEAERFRADIVMCDALTVYGDGSEKNDTIQNLPQSCNLTSKELYPELLLEFAGAVWRCIYKRALINRNTISFPEGLKFSEDRVFNLYAMAHANLICYLKMPLYMRYVNMESCVNRYHKDHFYQAKLAARETEKVLRLEWNNDEVYQKTYLRQFVDASCAAVHGIANAGKNIPLKEKLKKLRTICNDLELQNALKQSGYLGENGKWIQKKRVLFLCWYTDAVRQKLLNVKEEYTASGLVGVFKKCMSKLKK